MKVLQDYSWIRGANLSLDSYPDLDVLRRDLSYGKRLNLNQVRFWTNPDYYMRDGEKYIASLVEVVRTCHACGYGVMPIIWNGNGLNPRLLEPDYWAEKADAYTTDLVNALKDEPGLFMWDVMNEPTCNNWIQQAPEDEKQSRLDRLYAFVKHKCDLIRQLDPVNAITVGNFTAYEMGPTCEYVDVISFHDYMETRLRVEKNFSLADEAGKKFGKPVIQTETGCICRANPYDVALQACEKHNMGWYVFELMIRGYWDNCHGIFYPDGTVRDPSIPAALMGCYRNRGDSLVVGAPNREGQGNDALNAMKAILNEYNGNGFAYRKGDIGQLLEICEIMANLLEAAELVPMAKGPVVQILKFRAMDHPPMDEVRAFAYELAQTMKKACQILD